MGPLVVEVLTRVSIFSEELNFEVLRKGCDNS
jgi:hypothetical protein